MSKMMNMTLLTLVVLVCVAPRGASAASVDFGQLIPINQDEFVIGPAVMQFYMDSQPLLNQGGVQPPAFEQQTLTHVETDLNNIINTEKDELKVMQAIPGMPANLIAIQTALINAWGGVLTWEQNNGVFSQPTHPPTAQAVLGVGVELTLALYYTQYKLYLVNANGFSVLPAVLNGQIHSLNNAFLSEQANLPYVAPVGTF
jgi:hypothetical protein